MVFESVVAELLNRFLGSYVDNLNASQLNIGIWGGDVKLNNLEIKETALDELDLPVKLKFGYIQNLTLKIPWKNLYTEPTKVDISELYIIIVPNQGVLYNEEKARKNEHETKQKKLLRLEENRRNRNKEITTSDTFTEKLVAQVIKNLQVRIKRVHIRYEDKFSNRDRPFATGFTLNSLDFQTTDENFELTIEREVVKIFHKLISLNHFGLYSNANSDLISDIVEKNAIIDALRNSIASKETRPQSYKYVLDPLSMKAKLKLNQKPEADDSDWTIPKIDLSLDLEKLYLAIGKFQYQDFLLFLEAQERFKLSEQYIKYRPNLTAYKDHYKEWWHFAYNCILNEQVKRRRNNWSWERMKRHRKMVRQYRDAWIFFRTEKTPNSATKKTIEEAERLLDLFNLNIARQQAEFEIDRQKLTRVEDQEEQGWVGWAKSWFGGGAKKTEKGHGETDAKIMDKIEEAITPEEKQRLFDAIDYQENTPPTDYPKEYIENLFKLKLSELLIALEDVLEMRFEDLSAQFEQRPSANAFKFESCVKKFEMNAVEQQKSQPMLMMTDTNRSWLCLKVETNPLEEDFDQAISLQVAPVMLKYHAPAINKALDVFKPPESVRLHQLTALAIARYEDVKARSATALQHMVEDRKKLNLEIQIDPATIILCQGGIFSEEKPSLIAELGILKIKSLEQGQEKHYQQITDPKLRKLYAKAYDNYQMTLSNLQLIFADTFGSCMMARGDRNSCHHLLKPTGLTFDLYRSTIDDINLPMIRLFGELPDLVLLISDVRLIKLLELLNSVPRPVFEEEIVDLAAPVDGTKLRDRAKMVAIMEVNELDESSIQQKSEDTNREQEESARKTEAEKKPEPVIRERQIQLDLNLNLNEVGLIVSRKDQRFLSAHIRRLGLHMRKKMFDMVVQAHLGSLTLEMPQIESADSAETLYLIENEIQKGDHLINVTYKQATEESPTFKTEFASNEQSMHFVFQTLNFNLHKHVLNDLKNFSDQMQRKLAKIQPPQIDQQLPHTKKRTPSQSSRRSRESSVDRKQTNKRKISKFTPGVRPVKQKKFVFDFRMHEIAAKLYAKQEDIMGGIDPDQDETAILEFCAVNIQRLNLDGNISEDGSMRCEIGLQTFTMDDRRKNAKIQRLMDKKDVKSSDKFIIMKYSQNSNNDKFVDILSSKFYLMLAPEFLGVLSSFFIFHPDQEDEDGEQQDDAAFLIPNQQPIASSPMKITTAQQALSRTPEKIVPPAAGTLTLNCRIYAIEVILIENSIYPEESQAMIMSFDAIVDAKNVNGIQKMQGGIQQLKIYSTYFAPERRHLSNYPILKELDIRFTGSIDEKERSQKFAVSMDEVAIRVSPSIIRLLSAVSTQFSQHQKKDETLKSSREKIREYPDYRKPKKIESEKFWWFRTMNDIDDNAIVDEVAVDAKTAMELVTNEQAEFSIKRFVVTVEAGVKDFTRPMILLESTLYGSAQNWSSQLLANAEARLQISYYNETFNVWEPVIEPVLHEHEGWQSWRLRLNIGPEEEKLTEPSTSKTSKKKEDVDKKAIPPPKMAIRIEAKEMMNITITKSFLRLLNQLSDSFEKAAKQISPPKSRQLPGTSSYLLLNETGSLVKVANTKTIRASLNDKPAECQTGQYIPMERIGVVKNGTGNWQMSEDERQLELHLLLPEFETERKINISRSEMQCIDLPRVADSGRKWALVVNTNLENARHVVTLHSLVNVVNHLHMPIEIRSLKDTEGTLCGVIQPNAEESLNIPLKHLYTPNGEFAIRPQNDAYDWSNEFSWHDFDTTTRRTVRDKKANSSREGFFVEIVVNTEKIRRGPRLQTCQYFTVHLFPPVHLMNMLPIDIKITEPNKKEVKSGDGVDLYNLIPGVPFIFTLEYGGETYKKELVIPTQSNRDDLQAIKLNSTKSNKQMCLGLSWSTEFLKTTLSLYTPYWMVNETGKELFYKGLEQPSGLETPHRQRGLCKCCPKACQKLFTHTSTNEQSSSNDICHPPGQNPLILPLNEHDFFEKKKAKLRILDSQWSSDFPLDTAGNSGRITCQSANREYELTIDVKLCNNGLTKVITISAFYLLQNNSKFPIEVREPNRKEWINVPSQSVIGFWPQQKAARKTLIARYANTREESIQFPFTKAFEGFVKIENNYIGIYVNVLLSDDSSVIHMENFIPGMLPAILMNATNHPIEYWQLNSENKQILQPQQMVPFTWDHYPIEEKEEAQLLQWNSGEASGSDALLHNRNISYLPSNTDGYHYWVSFLNGRQRTILFTNDAGVSLQAQQAYEMEQPNREVQFCLHGISISLVNNLRGMEVIYMAITSNQTGKNGFWMQYRETDHQTTIWVKMHNFQVDNQLPSSVFPSLLYMVPQPKSVVKNDPKPFLELSFVQNQSEHSKIVEIKLLEVLVQEFSVQLDQTLINEILDLFPKESIETEYNSELFAKDMELTRGSLSKRALQTRATQAQAYYEHLHISPLMIHLSFSQGHSKEKGESSIGIQWEFLNLLLKSVGVTLTEIQDVTFKLAFFNRDAVFYNRNQLQTEIQNHYTHQLIKQAYVLILGLDILGNPYGLIRDLASGVQDFFYQPYQGIVTGPLEFVEGVTLGINSLFSHSVGGVFGVASRITGTLGKGVAALTMDEEYQRKRLQSRQQPTNFGEGMARGVRGLGQGVVQGVTGVVSKPLEGAKKGGIGGFLKGTGKGLVGAIARPVSGVVDMATSVADSVKTVVTTSETIKPIRPPRVISSDSIIRPFVYEEAVGYKLFREINKGDFAETDHFLTYGMISSNLCYFVTDKHFIEARKHELTGNWNADWSPTYAEINKPELIVKPGQYCVKVPIKESRSGGILSLSWSKSKGKTIMFKTERDARRIYDKMLAAWESAA